MVQKLANYVQKYLEKMKKEKSIYEDLLKYLSSYKSEKVIMDKNMQVYHQKAKAAENSILNFKKLIIKDKIYNSEEILKQVKIMEDKSTEMSKESTRTFNIYTFYTCFILNLCS